MKHKSTETYIKKPRIRNGIKLKIQNHVYVISKLITLGIVILIKRYRSLVRQTPLERMSKKL